jgi:hypothetical protein
VCSNEGGRGEGGREREAGEEGGRENGGDGRGLTGGWKGGGRGTGRGRGGEARRGEGLAPSRCLGSFVARSEESEFGLFQAKSKESVRVFAKGKESVLICVNVEWPRRRHVHMR